MRFGSPAATRGNPTRWPPASPWCDIPGNQDLVVLGETGFLTRPDLRSDFARRTLPILEDAALAQRLGAAGKSRMEQQFSVAQMVDRYTRLYDDTAAR